MTDKQRNALNAILSALPEDCRDIYATIAERAISLGYMPSLKGARKDYADFTNSKLKRTILKISANPEYRGISMKFFAIPEYTGIFERAVRDRLATWRRLGYKFSCFGCGKCDGTQGYDVALEDGARGFLCGFGVLPLPGFCADNVGEIVNAMKIQHEFFAGK